MPALHRMSIAAILTVSLFGGCADPNEWQEPFTAFNGRAYSDGGTLGIELRDSRGKILICCVSQDGFDDTVPGDTLFLDGWHASEESARLPRNQAEVDFIKRALRSAAGRAYSDLQISDAIQSGTIPHLDEENWDAKFALTILRRINSRSSVETWDPANGEFPPKWWAEYDRDRQERIAKQRHELEVHQQFLALYPPEARDALDGQSGMVTVMPGVDEGSITDDEEHLACARIVAESFGNPIDLAATTCRAFALLDGSWTGLDECELIAIAAAHTVSGDDFAQAVSQLDGDDSANFGIARALFSLGFDRKLSDEDWINVVPRFAEEVLNDNRLMKGDAVVESLARRRFPEGDRTLLRIARGEVGAAIPPPNDGGWDKDEPSLPSLAWLKLSERGNATHQDEVEKQLDGVARDADRVALEAALALMGQTERLSAEHFKTFSYPVGLAAVRAVEKSPDRVAVGLLFSAGLDHPYAAVANEAILAAQRITGRRWITESTRHQPRNFKEKAKAWWEENSEDYTPSKPSAVE